MQLVGGLFATDHALARGSNKRPHRRSHDAGILRDYQGCSSETRKGQRETSSRGQLLRGTEVSKRCPLLDHEHYSRWPAIVTADLLEATASEGTGDGHSQVSCTSTVGDDPDTATVVPRPPDGGEGGGGGWSRQRRVAAYDNDIAHRHQANLAVLPSAPRAPRCF